LIKNIVTIGAGYVGTSLSVLLSQSYQVTVVDNNESKLDLINRNISPISDQLIQDFFNKKKLNLKTSSSIESAIKNSDLIILSLPTNYNSSDNYFDTSILEEVICRIFKSGLRIPILIKSTVPIGFTEKMIQKYKGQKIIFSPEFLREGKALHDNLNPSRIVIGEKSELGKQISNIFFKLALNKPKTYLISSTEAEAVKLFSNSFLANRVTFFNELDSFCIDNDLDTKSVIDCVSSDSRIGSEYNNPSFGYGGYCLPKDTKQLLSNFKDTPQDLFSAIVKGNETRKIFIANHILKSNPKVVGIYRLTMKTNSDNFRESAIFDIARYLMTKGIKIIAYEPLVTTEKYEEIMLIKSFINFKKDSDIILANRTDKNLHDVIDKVFTRDVYEEN